MPLYRSLGNPQFQKNRKVFFKYEGVVENGIRGTTNNVTKIKMTSKIEIQTWESCNYLLKVDYVHVSYL